MDAIDRMIDLHRKGQISDTSLRKFIDSHIAEKVSEEVKKTDIFLQGILTDKQRVGNDVNTRVTMRLLVIVTGVPGSVVVGVPTLYSVGGTVGAMGSIGLFLFVFLQALIWFVENLNIQQAKGWDRRANAVLNKFRPKSVDSEFKLYDDEKRKSTHTKEIHGAFLILATLAALAFAGFMNGLF
jgi:hypothetical protein